MMASIKDLNVTQGIDVRYMKCINPCDNETFKRLCKQEGMGVKVKWWCTTKNGRLTEICSTLYNMIQAMLNDEIALFFEECYICRGS